MKISLGKIAVNSDVVIPKEVPATAENEFPGIDTAKAENPGETQFLPHPDITAQATASGNLGNEIFPTDPQCK